jgi:glutaminyl-peptide cyclotransferase
MVLPLLLLLSLRHAPAVTFDSARAWKDLNTQVDFGPRMPGTDAHRKCRDFLLGRTKVLCDKGDLQEFRHVWSRNNQTITMWNVWGTQNWDKATTRVVLMAHWDSRPSAEQDPNPANRLKPIPGANDGASGVAVLLELMRDFKEKAPNVGIMYVFSDGEDLGPGLEEMFLGAEVFPKLPMDNKPDYGILLDMIGGKSLKVPMEPNSVSFAPKLMKALYGYAGQIGLGSSFPSEMGPEIEDDHLPVNKAGIPMIDLIDFDYEPWHTLNDVPAQCSAESLKKVGTLLESWLRQEPAFTNK